MWDFYEQSSPIRIEGGIKANSKRGQFSNSWWGKRWIEALESFNDSGRLSRGRSYARQGQVVSIDIKVGEIVAKVQGSRKTPYQVKIEMEKLSEISWQQVIHTLSLKAIYSARLLAGELPHDIEEIFKEVNIQLLPSHHGHLKTDCSCPDWSNPCKHVAAVFYLLGEEFDRDPFLLFKVRGIDKETFLKHLEKKSPQIKATKNIPLQQIDQEKRDQINADPKLFWEGAPLPDQWLSEGFEKPRQTGILMKSLGKFPFWRGEKSLQESCEDIYEKTTVHTIQLLEKD